MKRSVKFLMVVFITVFTFTAAFPASAATTAPADQPFSDVPADNPAFAAIGQLRSLGITQGIGDNKFGMGKTLTRGEFITWMVKLLGLTLENPAKGSFSDNQDKNAFYYKSIETALKNGLISKADKFRPNANVTREEMAIMLVSSLGYRDLATRLSYLGEPFSDTNFTASSGFITIATDFGLMSPVSDKLFKPSSYITRDQAAVSMIDTYNRRYGHIKELNAFYSISSYAQSDKIADLTSTCFGWSRLTFDAQSGQVVLNKAKDGTSHDEYSIPDGFSEVVDKAHQSGEPAMLSVFATQGVKVTDPSTGTSIGIIEYVLTHPEVGDKLINDICAQLALTTRDDESESFDGVVIDFEGLKGESLKAAFNTFLQNLRTKLDENEKKLYVTVQPLIATARSSASYDGYDYKTIGSLADKVILMAHDYDATSLTDAEMASGWNITPLAPIEDVYYALKAITNKDSGIQDRSKIMLQLSFEWIEWQKQNGKILNRTPLNYNYENFLKLVNGNSAINYKMDAQSLNPYLKFTDASGVENTVWYEDSRSVQAKIDLAEMFGIQGISLWRLGQIPDYTPAAGGVPVYMDVWQTILSEMGR